ncbi:hypothetical protein ACFX2G_019567 [Malus domestica]
MKAEVEKIKGIGFVREVNYPTWVANVVLVKKNPTKESLMLQKVLWRMCVDYTDLNKGCPKDSFPLPLIDRLIDSRTGCELLSSMDAYNNVVWMGKFIYELSIRFQPESVSSVSTL